MALLDGVRIGPLDPDRAENLGQIGGQSSARVLIRHHIAMHPPALVGALSRERQDERSKAIDRDEAEKAIADAYEENGEPLPEGSEINGLAVRGHEDQPSRQVLTFTAATPSGRTVKGAIPYRDNDDTLSRSIAAGDQVIRIRELKEAGLPWEPGAIAEQVGGIAGTGVKADDGEAARLSDELDDAADREESLREENAQLRERLAQLEGQRRTDEQKAQDDGDEPTRAGLPSDSGVVTSPQAAEGGSVDLQDVGSAGEPEMPWEGFESANAQEVRARLRDNRDPAEARRVLAWEQRSDGGANRSTVIAAANEVLDRSGG